MKITFTCIFFFILKLASPPSLMTIREEFPKAYSNESVATSLYQSLQSVTLADSPVLVGYKGAVLTLQAKFSKNINEKKQFVKEGISLIEDALKKEPNNIEIRSLRLGVQENIPNFIGYHDDLEKDKVFILKQYQFIKNEPLRTYIKNFILQSSSFSEEEKHTIQ